MYKYIQPINGFESVVCYPGAFTGVNAQRGDKDTAAGVTDIFKVTGDVLVRIYGVCRTTIVGAGTIELGVTGNTAGLIAQIANATTLAANEIWNDATPTEVGVGLLSNILGEYLVVNSTTIQEKVGTADLTAGEVYYVCLWRALSPGAIVEVAPKLVLPVFSSLSPSASLSPSVSVSPSASPSVSPSVSISPSISVSPSASPSISPSISVSPSKSPSISPSISISPTASPSLSPSVSSSPSKSPSISPSASPSVSPSISPSPSP